MSIVFEVIDLDCQQSDNSFFVPNVTMTTKSTTTFATVIGYSEFGTPSVPPKKYRKVTISGTSERIGFTVEQTPRQAAGAQYVWSGSGEIDLQGNQISKYSKKFYAQCSKQYWPPVPVLANPFSISPCLQIPFCSFVGYCWTTDPNSCSTCDPNINNWPFISDQATNNPVADLTGFLVPMGGITVTPTSYSVNGQFFAFTEISVNEPFQAVLSGVHYDITVGPDTFDGESVFTTPATLTFPVVSVEGVVAQYINFVDANNYSAVLSEEYTDADAIANATVINGTGATAQNLPRTTGFTSQTTSVVFALSCGNLIGGRNYVVSVDFWQVSQAINPETGEPFSQTTTQEYNFTASGGTNTIVDIVPTPTPGNTIQVKNPRINFA